VAVVVTDGNKGLETCALTGTGLLLDGHNLQNLILQLRPQERVDDLGFFDGKGEEIDLLQSPDFLVLDEPAQFGDWDPLSLFLTAASTATSSAATSATSTVSASTTAATTTVAKSTTETSTIGWC